MRESRFLCCDIHAHRVAQTQLIAQDLQGLLLCRDDLPGRLDLRAHGRLLDGGGDDIGGQRDVSGLERKALGIRLRSQRLDLAPIGAEDVRHEPHRESRRVKLVVEGRSRCRGFRQIVAVALDAE